MASFYPPGLVTRFTKPNSSANAKRDLPGLVQEVVEPLAALRLTQQRAFERYRTQVLSEEVADHAILAMYRRGVINVQRIPDVLKEWETPSFEEMSNTGRTAWRLFNAVTFVLTGRVVANPAATQELHNIIDGVCETLH